MEIEFYPFDFKKSTLYKFLLNWLFKKKMLLTKLSTFLYYNLKLIIMRENKFTNMICVLGITFLETKIQDFSRV